MAAPAPADPKWRERRWQLRDQPRSDYIQQLVEDIADCKRYIKQYDDIAMKHPNCVELAETNIKYEREALTDYNEELRKVVGDGQSSRLVKA